MLCKKNYMSNVRYFPHVAFHWSSLRMILWLFPRIILQIVQISSYIFLDRIKWGTHNKVFNLALYMLTSGFASIFSLFSSSNRLLFFYPIRSSIGVVPMWSFETFLIGSSKEKISPYHPLRMIVWGMCFILFIFRLSFSLLSPFSSL